MRRGDEREVGGRSEGGDKIEESQVGEGGVENGREGKEEEMEQKHEQKNEEKQKKSFRRG